jgi:hypothetical protein
MTRPSLTSRLLQSTGIHAAAFPDPLDPPTHPPCICFRMQVFVMSGMVLLGLGAGAYTIGRTLFNSGNGSAFWNINLRGELW